MLTPQLYVQSMHCWGEDLINPLPAGAQLDLLVDSKVFRYYPYEFVENKTRTISDCNPPFSYINMDVKQYIPNKDGNAEGTR